MKSTRITIGEEVEEVEAESSINYNPNPFNSGSQPGVRGGSPRDT